MDIKLSNDYRMGKYTQYNKLGSTKYDYEKYGILTRTLPKILFKGNQILSTFLQFIDVRIVMVLKYIDRLKNFKHIDCL